MFERKVTGPLASIIASNSVEPGDRVLIDCRNPEDDELTFIRKKGLLILKPKPRAPEPIPDFPLPSPQPLPGCDWDPYIPGNMGSPLDHPVPDEITDDIRDKNLLRF